MQQILPEAVKEGGDVVCANGETIPKLLVVNKVKKKNTLYNRIKFGKKKQHLSLDFDW